MISNIDSEQAISISNTIQKKIQTPPEMTGNSITKKTKKEYAVVKKNPETRKETQIPIFEKIGDSTYRISDRADLSKVAELAAIEFAETNKDQDFFWSDFNKAIGGDPVSVLDECSNSYYELIPLYIYGEYAGVVTTDYLNKKTIKVYDIFPSSFFHTNNLYELQDNFIPIGEKEAVTILKNKLGINVDHITYKNLVIPCIGNAMYSPKTDPFYSFYIGTNQYLVNIRNGELITEKDKDEIEGEIFKYLEDKNTGNNLNNH